MRYRIVDSPVGDIIIVVSDAGVHQLSFLEERTPPVPADWQRDNSGITFLAEQQLHAYFVGESQRFSLPLAPAGTPFQLRVWQQLLTIPFGQSCSYQSIAQQIQKPTAVRAVASAIGKNPLAILTPCHRVLSSSNTLSGFRWGIERKAQLLDLEGISYRH